MNTDYKAKKTTILWQRYEVTPEHQTSADKKKVNYKHCEQVPVSTQFTLSTL